MNSCYLLTPVKMMAKANAKTYVGFTVDPAKRLRQHNLIISGGAFKTSKNAPWMYVCIVSGFPTHRSALQFEWAWQHPTESIALRPHVNQLLVGKKGVGKVGSIQRKLIEMVLLVSRTDAFKNMPLIISFGSPHFTDQNAMDITNIPNLANTNNNNESTNNNNNNGCYQSMLLNSSKFIRHPTEPKIASINELFPEHVLIRDLESNNGSCVVDALKEFQIKIRNQRMLISSSPMQFTDAADQDAEYDYNNNSNKDVDNDSENLRDSEGDGEITEVDNDEEMEINNENDNAKRRCSYDETNENVNSINIYTPPSLSIGPSHPASKHQKITNDNSNIKHTIPLSSQILIDLSEAVQDIKSSFIDLDQSNLSNTIDLCYDSDIQLG